MVLLNLWLINLLKKMNNLLIFVDINQNLTRLYLNFLKPLIQITNLKIIIYIINGKKFYCDGNICGHAMTLSTAQDLKSSNFNKVKTIIFDEFIIESGQKKYYLKDEVFVFLNLIETIARLRNVRIFLLANSVTVTNPYFLYFDINLPYNSDIVTYKNRTNLGSIYEKFRLQTN